MIYYYVNIGIELMYIRIIMILYSNIIYSQILNKLILE